MGTIADKLSYLGETKREIREAITEKGVEVSENNTFRSYADLIRAIETGGGEDGEEAKVIAINYSQLGSGIFTETLEGGETITYNVTLDSKGRVTQITNGSHTASVTW